MSTADSIARYDAALPPAQAAIARKLRWEIEAALPDAVSKVWHRHPVWFDGENPIVGYDARKTSVSLLFWNGQALDEPELVPVGKYRAAGRLFREASEVDPDSLRRWLEKARTNVFDGVTYFRTLREAAKRSAAGSPPEAPLTEANPGNPPKAPRRTSNTAAARGRKAKR